MTPEKMYHEIHRLHQENDELCSLINRLRTAVTVISGLLVVMCVTLAVLGT